MTRRPRVALLIESSRSYGRGLLHGVSEYLRLHGPWSVYLNDRGLADAPPPWLRKWQGDGVIARVETRRVAEAIRKLGVPAINLRGRFALDMPLIETDEEVVVRLAVDHFRARGFRQFAFCGFAGANYSETRCELFVRRLAEAGFACQVYEPPGPVTAADTPGREQAPWAHQAHLVRWVRALPRPTALLACNDIRGHQVLNACREAEVAIPDEMAVLGVDNDEVLCDLSAPPLSSVVPNTRRIGYEAAELLDRLMAGGPAPTETRLVEPLGVETRQSTDVVAVDDREVAAAVRYIRDHACKGAKVTDVLSVVTCSLSSLERRFHQALGRTIKSELQRVQMDRVRWLLAETDLPLREVANRTGFGHVEYLSVAFKNQTGETPGGYRTRVRGG